MGSSSVLLSSAFPLLQEVRLLIGMVECLMELAWLEQQAESDGREVLRFKGSSALWWTKWCGTHSG